MVSLVARTGRQFQRYNQGRRLVVGCIPYRYKRSSPLDGNLKGEFEVLVISAQRKGKGMLFPKGGWEMDESMEEAALRETIEEAGVIGKVENKLGRWKFESKSQGTVHEGYMFPLLVNEQLDLWPEKNIRERRWMTVEEAKKACKIEWMRKALDVLVQRLVKMQHIEEEMGEDDDVDFLHSPCTLCLPLSQCL